VSGRKSRAEEAKREAFMPGTGAALRWRAIGSIMLMLAGAIGRRMMIAKSIAVVAVAAVGVGLLLGNAAAQPYPNRPIKLIVPFPAGGPPDTIARLVGNDMSSRLGQTVVIDNRPGAGATIGTRTAASAEPDGYTLLFASTTSLSIGPALFKNLDYDAVKSFAPVASVSLGAMVVAVNAAVPAKTLQELVAYAKANPGKLHNGAGVASPPHIAWGLFTLTTGTDIVFVPYRGMAQAMTDLVAGQIQMMIDGIGSLLPHIRDGKVRAVAVTGTTRSGDLADVPTMIESGYPDYVLSFWTGILAPAGTPPDIVAKLNGVINDGLKSAQTKHDLAKFNVEPNITSSREFSAFLAAEARKWADIVKATNIKVE
jgi:tripartite-type tricarboxylate transporter receptor subunit TctC